MLEWITAHWQELYAAAIVTLAATAVLQVLTEWSLLREKGVAVLLAGMTVLFKLTSVISGAITIIGVVLALITRDASLHWYAQSWLPLIILALGLSLVGLLVSLSAMVSLLKSSILAVLVGTVSGSLLALAAKIIWPLAFVGIIAALMQI